MGETGEGFVWDLTQMVVIDRRVGTYPPALPKWEGGWSVDGCDGFPRAALFEEV